MDEAGGMGEFNDWGKAVGAIASARKFAREDEKERAPALSPAGQKVAAGLDEGTEVRRTYRGGQGRKGESGPIGPE
jgi:hypothetical protein